MTTKNDPKTVETASIYALANCAAEIGVEVLNNLSPGLRERIAAALEHGRLSLIVTIHPRLQIIVAFDPDDPRAAPVRLAAWSGDAPVNITESLH